MELGNVAPWKWGVLIGAGVLSVIVWIVVLGGGEEPPFADEIHFVDIETGQLYALSTKNQLTMPAQNPETGKFTLFEVTQDENDNWIVDGRALNALQQNKSLKVKIDWQSGKTETNGKEMQRVE